MKTIQDYQPYYDSILKYLYEQSKSDKDKYHKSDYVFKALGINNETGKQTIEFIWHEPKRKIDALRKINYADIRINEEGGRYVEAKLLPIEITDLQGACEIIFQHHKKYIISNWTRDTYPSINARTEVAAMNMLERQKIIFKPNPINDPSATQINDLVMHASSFIEALEIIEQKNKPTPSFQGIYAPNNKGTVAQSLGDDSPNTQSVTTTPNKKNSAPKTNWYNKPLFTHFIWPLIVGLIILAITIFLSMKYGLKS